MLFRHDGEIDFEGSINDDQASEQEEEEFVVRKLLTNKKQVVFDIEGWLIANRLLEFIPILVTKL